MELAQTTILADLSWLVIASRWLHIASVLTVVGGSIFICLVLYPAIRTALDDTVRESLRAQVLRRWARVVHVAITLIIISGIYNTVVVFPQHPGQPLYHALYGVKVILALVVFFIATAVLGRSPAFASLRRRGRLWITLNVVLALIVVLISNVLKNLPPAIAG